MARGKRHYTEEQRINTVALARKVGSRAAAEMTGISYSCICMWRRERNVTDGKTASLKDEVIMLREQNTRLWEANQSLHRTLEQMAHLVGGTPLKVGEAAASL